MNSAAQTDGSDEQPNFPEGVAKIPMFFKRALQLLGILAVLLIGYSIYVKVHEPDPQETVVLGQDTLASASPAGLRILVRNRISYAPVPKAEVVVSLADKKAKVTKLGTFETDSYGSISEAVNIPELPAGEYELRVDVKSSLGRDHIVRKVALRSASRVLLSSDKPVYQPGQTIHLRTLASNARTQKPLANDSLTFEVSDPKGNKVFKETRVLSAFGIASADFVLANELNLGRYAIRASTGTGVAERTVEIERYVLPKFKIQINTDKSYYLPGQTVSGSIQAKYFFGKPVSGANVKLSASSLPNGEIHGRTDTDGKYDFHFTLPEQLAGQPLNNEQAMLDLTAEVTDSGEHAEQQILSIPVAREEMELSVIPEDGEMVRGVDNLVYAIAVYPDGRPAVCRVFVNGVAYQGDAQGVSVVKVPASLTDRKIEFEARDDSGRKAKATLNPENNEGTPPLLVRTDKAVYEAGQVANLTLLSTEADSTVFLDVIKENQTVLTKSVPLQHHQANYSLPLPPAIVGTLKLNAYLITASGEDRGRSRLIYVNPASSLQIKARLEKPVYRPGEVAKIEFNVSDAQGRPAPSALGIAAVDESVFALAESRPGLLRQFLDVEADLMTPRYQIKSFADPENFLTSVGGDESLAQAFFASQREPIVKSQIDNLVAANYLSPQLLDQIRSLRGTAQYEALRNDPQYAPLLREIEGENQGVYTIRTATGPIKFQAAEAHRNAYFKALKGWLMIGLLATIILLPIGSMLYQLSCAGASPAGHFPDETDARWAALASTTHQLLASMILFPLIFYPVGCVLLEQLDWDRGGYVLLGFEIFITFALLGWRCFAIARTNIPDRARGLMRVQRTLVAFLLQFICSRTLIIFLVLRGADAFLVLWFLASLAAPFFVVASLELYLRQEFAELGIPYKSKQPVLLNVLVVIAVIFILAGLLLPALAKAKGKAIGIRLISDLKQVSLANQTAAEDQTPASAGALSAPPRVRRDFPETLLWQPELITDDLGKATLEIPLADSITTWRASVDAVNSAGKLGSAELPITVFQDFFIDLDLPVSLSLDDEIAVPITCYNYLKTPQKLRVTLACADWFSSEAPAMSLDLNGGEVKTVRFPIKVSLAGNHLLRVTAQGSSTSDAIEREIRVKPTGQEIALSKNDVLKEQFDDTIEIPAGAIPNSESLRVKFYPSHFSEVVEGLDSVFQAPYGCFEQTSSTTYPNVLVLDYMKRMGRLTPEIEVKARKYINAGYQRLLTFEVPGGGFEWFGRTPANVCLTAYGILEFTDMDRVHPVDENVIERARQWLFAQQSSDGSWSENKRGWTWGGRGSITAFVTWALAESGNQSVNLDKALDYLRSHPAELSDTYAKALAANAFLARDHNDSCGRNLAAELKDAAIVDGAKTMHWDSHGYSVTYSHGSGMETEVTALVCMALMKSGQAPESVKEGMTWISNRKFADGTHGSTQATILAMRALLAASEASLGQEFNSSVTLLLNGKAIQMFGINKENSDVMRQFDLTAHLQPGKNELQLRQSPAGELTFQLDSDYWLPASKQPAAEPNAIADIKPMEIEVQYDRTKLAVNDQISCSVSVRNNTGRAINMAIVDLGIPPGFDPDAGAFESMQQTGKIEKFETTGNQIILYLRALSETAPFRFTYALRAKYPLRAQTPQSAVYEYYEPQNRAESKSVALQVSSD